jgi:F0F1-type ATP synthase delta subunit
MIIIFLQVFFLQLLLAGVVVYVLKEILHRQLIDLAIKRFQNISITTEDQKLTGIIVVSPRKINCGVRERLRVAVSKKFGRPMEIISKIDKRLRGGLVIKLNSLTIDFSLMGRLKEGGIITD